MKLMDRIKQVSEKINNFSDGDIPDLVFVEEVPEGFQITEDYMKRNSKGQVIQGGRRKTYITKESLDEIRTRYSSHTTIYEGMVKE